MKRAALVTIAGLVLTVMGWSCTPTSSAPSPTLSKSRAAPGEYITIEHGGIEPGLPVTVEFSTSDGMVIRVQSYDVADGRVGVAVPPVYDPETATLGAGHYEVSIAGLAGRANLDVDDLPAVEGVEPGGVLAAVLEMAIENYQHTMSNLALIEAEAGHPGSAISTDSVVAEIARLQAMLDELEATGQLVVDLEGIGTATVTPELLRTGDRLLVSMLTSPTAGAAAKRGPNQRDIAECISGDVPPGFDRTACLREVVSDIGTAVLPAVESGGRMATGFGVVITVIGATAGLVAATPVGAVLAAGTAANLALAGLVVSVSGGAVSVVSATLQGKNTDAFLQDSAEDFNIGLEILSQMVRVLISGAATGFEPQEDIFTTITTWGDRFVTGMDAYVGFSCSQDTNEKSVGPRLGSITFCTVVRPGTLCDNTCATAFDGVCDDGGEGAPRSGCALGTDCLDCGGREEPSSGGESLCTDACLFAFDGECDDGGPGSVTAFCSYGADCGDCGARDPQDEPTGDEEAACCYSTGCSMETFNACALSAGDFLGEGTSCTSDACPTDEPAAEYVVWYTDNVRCWGAPLLYITDRAGFERAEIASSYPGGGIDPVAPLMKAEMQGGFESVEAARAWICPQFVSRFSHYWCSQYYQTGSCNWQPGSLGCDLSSLPLTDTPPDGAACE